MGWGWGWWGGWGGGGYDKHSHMTVQQAGQSVSGKCRLMSVSSSSRGLNWMWCIYVWAAVVCVWGGGGACLLSGQSCNRHGWVVV